jgi:mercuric ion transport protein
MSDRARTQIGAIGGALAAIVCCAAPLLIAALGSLGVGSALVNGLYLLIPILAVVIGLAGLRLYRRRANADPCCEDQSLKEGFEQWATVAPHPTDARAMTSP